MINLNRKRYMVENTIAETFLNFDDVNRLTSWLIGKRSSHLIIHVINGQKSRLFTVDNDNSSKDILSLRESLLKTMNEL